MTIFTSPKQKGLPFATVAFTIAFLFLLYPGKMLAQKEKVQITKSYVLQAPGVSVVSQAGKNPTQEEASGKAPATNSPDPNAVLAPPANDNCIAAIALTSGPACTFTAGTTLTGTQSLAAITCAGFTGVADDDVWYRFTATFTSHTITVAGAANMDAVIDLRTAPCNGVNLACADATAGGGTEVIVYNAFTIGNTYYIRVYDYLGGGGDFNICITDPPPPAPNDNCATATLAANSLSPNGNCKYGSTNLSTVQPGETFGCLGAGSTASVWYSFIATQANMWLAIRPEPTGTYSCLQSFGMRVYNNGACPPAGAVACKGYTVYSGNQINNVLNMTTLVAGNTYLVQVTPDPTCGNLSPNFCIRLDEPSTCTTCANVCGPMCIWAGSPPTVTDITSTCPSYAWSPPMNQFDTQTNCYSFTAVNDTVWLQQIVYAYCSPGNTFSFTYTLYTAGCAQIGPANIDVFTNNLITGLSIGTTYRICYTLQSACSWDSVAWPYAYTTSSVLPVELVSFGAMPYQGKVKIYWATASEENAKEFIIERTRNARDFTEIARIKASGNSTSLINYKSYDDNPLRGENYYRLKQIDFNGEATYTRLVSAKFLPSVADLDIVPNPAKDNANIRFNAAGKYTTFLKVTNMQGKILWSRQIVSEEGMNEYSLNMNELSKGIYSVQVLVDDQNMISKLVKE